MSQDISQLELQQAEKLAEIGDRLRQAREEQQLTLEQVAAKTLIQPRLLGAIEVAKLDRLPEPVYIQGFIRRYAEALGLNGGDLAKTFPTDTGIRPIQPSWQESSAAQLRPLHLWVAYIVVVIAAVSALSYLISRSGPWSRPQVANNQSAPAVQAEEEAAGTEPAAPPAAGTATAPTVEPTTDPAIAGKPVQVEIELTAQSWLRVTVDGQRDFEGVLPEGTQRSWAADTQLTVRAGNAGGVMLSYNNGEAERLGEPGAVREVTFTPTQDAASLPTTPTTDPSIPQ